MSPPLGPAPPPYTSSASASASASGSQPNAATTPSQQRKTVRFQTQADGVDGDDPPARRNSTSTAAAAAPLAAPAVGSNSNPATTAGTADSSSNSNTNSSSNTPPVVANPVLRTNPFPDLRYFSSFYGSGLSNGRAAASSSDAPSYGSRHSQPAAGGSINHSNHNNNNNTPPGKDDDGKVVRPNLLQPRVAVVLGVPRIWHLPLFLSRLLSVCPAIWWSLGILIRLITQLHALAVTRGGTMEATDAAGAGLALHDRGPGLSLESRLKLTETALAMIWCGAAAYLSFFFTDCLMSRWLINYTPQATIVRLLAINALTGYLTSWVIYLMGSGGDSRLLLPAWVAIAAIMTGCYHATHNKINIRKETSISISVFSFASFISMAALLSQLYWDRPEYVDVPVVALTRRLCTEAARIVGNLFDIGNITMDL